MLFVYMCVSVCLCVCVQSANSTRFYFKNIKFVVLLIATKMERNQIEIDLPFSQSVCFHKICDNLEIHQSTNLQKSINT